MEVGALDDPTPSDKPWSGGRGEDDMSPLFPGVTCERQGVSFTSTHRSRESPRAAGPTVRLHRPRRGV